jgi:hypothetical protein
MKMMTSLDINSPQDTLEPAQQSGRLDWELKSEIKAAIFLASPDLTEEQKREIRHILETEVPYLELLESQLIKNCRQLQIASRTLFFSKGQTDLLLVQRARIQKEIIAARQDVKSKIFDELSKSGKPLSFSSDS